MKFLKFLFKPEFSWFEILVFTALLALGVSFVVFLFAAFILGIVNAAVYIYFERKEEKSK